PDNISVSFDAAQMQQVFSNLVMNAILSKESGVEVQISAAAVSVAEVAESFGASPEASKLAANSVTPNTRSVVRIVITDNGNGIGPDDLPQVFEPFFTTRDVGQGTGLGLSIAHGIVTEHGGWMMVDSVLEEGTTFKVFLPIEVEV
ncbi:MAG: ATP-binding protein, partial [Planctomycetota bacterium]|nr:ATP-binding protein [Planctomycetota bacterium]